MEASGLAVLADATGRKKTNINPSRRDSIDKTTEVTHSAAPDSNTTKAEAPRDSPYFGESRLQINKFALGTEFS